MMNMTFLEVSCYSLWKSSGQVIRSSTLSSLGSVHLVEIYNQATRSWFHEYFQTGPDLERTQGHGRAHRRDGRQRRPYGWRRESPLMKQLGRYPPCFFWKSRMSSWEVASVYAAADHGCLPTHCMGLFCRLLLVR